MKPPMLSLAGERAPGHTNSNNRQEPDYVSEKTMDRRREVWHFDKSISLPVILTLITFVGALVGLYVSSSTEQALTKQSLQTLSARLDVVLNNQSKTDAEQNAEIKEIRKDTREAYERIDNKIDRLLAREAK